MTFRLTGPILLACAASYIAPALAQSHSGRASYHLHTSEMVTAARHEPRGSILKVTNPQNGKSVVVRVNDAGPFSPPGRILDLSTGAFSQIYGGLGRGHGPVTYEVVSRGGGQALSSRGGKRKRYAKSKRSRRYYKSYRRSRSARRSR